MGGLAHPARTSERNMGGCASARPGPSTHATLQNLYKTLPLMPMGRRHWPRRRKAVAAVTFRADARRSPCAALAWTQLVLVHWRPLVPDQLTQ